MFVSSLSEVDFILSQVNILLSEVNKKLDDCPEDSRSAILPRVYHIVSELEWTMSLSKRDLECEDGEKENCTYSGALSPPLSSSSSDVESLSWDHQDFYKIYYENDTDEEDEDQDELKHEDDDHGLVKVSASSHDESSRDEEESSDHGETMCEDAAPIREDDGEKFVSMMSASIQKLAPGSTYNVIRPKKFTVDLSQVNSRFLGNIPRPKEFVVQTCMDEAEAYRTRQMPGGMANHPRKWEFKWGYMTDCGVVPVPEDVVYGHVWSDSARDWILHATPDDGSSPTPPPRQRGGRFRG